MVSAAPITEMVTAHELITNHSLWFGWTGTVLFCVDNVTNITMKTGKDVACSELSASCPVRLLFLWGQLVNKI